MSSISVDAVANFIAASNTVEATSAVATRVLEIDQQAAAGLLQSLQQSQSSLESAAYELSRPPTLDGTGGVVDRSV